MKEDRIYFYDIVKCIASYLICLSHFGSLDIDIIKSQHYNVYFNYFFLGISSVGVPLFLMVNGAFIMNKNYPFQKIFYRSKSYGILYLVWGAITLLLLAPLFHDHYSIREFVQAIFSLKPDRTDHLWFLLAMIYIYILFPYFKTMYDRSEKIYSIYLIASIFLFTFGFVFINEVANAAGYFLHSVTLKQLNMNEVVPFNPFTPWFGYTLIYFICGGYIAKNLQLFNYKASFLLAGILMSLFLLFLFGLMKTNISGIGFDSVWGGHDSIMTLVMAFSLFVLCSKITLKNERLIQISRLVGVNTLGIYFIHMPLGYWMTDYYKRLAISNYFFADLFFALILMMVSLAISISLKQVPFLNRLVKI